ncbi:MAG: hypothetical protein JXA42_22000 [Anaerolineales bacterium]|nr:hypothetical protein [Anaerolineales bacterium]
MNHRDRVLAALNHREPNRIPIDFGGTVDSTISAISYQALRRSMKLAENVTRIGDIYQYTAIIDEDVRQAFGVDTTPVFYEPLKWRFGVLQDGSPAELPARFQPVVLDDDSQVVFDENGKVTLKMPAGGYYFDPVLSPLSDATGIGDIDRFMDEIETYDKPSHLDASYQELAERARILREETDYLIVGFFGGHILQAAQSLRGWETFLMDLMVNQKFAEALLDRLAEANIRNMKRYAETVGRYVHIIHFEDDLGMQDRPLMRPAVYRKVVKPYHQKMLSFTKSHCDAYILFHSDGAIKPFIPDLIEMGVDAINPVQVSATGMDTRTLKQEFGKDVTFWGAGCDNQAVMPHGSVKEVEDEVKRRIDDLAPGGGFVFAPIHNIQVGVPMENVVAMFETALEYGVY